MVKILWRSIFNGCYDYIDGVRDLFLIAVIKQRLVIICDKLNGPTNRRNKDIVNYEIKDRMRCCFKMLCKIVGIY